jgi:hypothetical protein
VSFPAKPFKILVESFPVNKSPPFAPFTSSIFFIVILPAPVSCNDVLFKSTVILLVSPEFS